MTSISPENLNPSNNQVCTFKGITEKDHLGFYGNSQIVFILICCFGIAINIGIFLISVFKVKNSLKNKVSSLNKILLFLSLSQFVISILWTINVISFYKTESIITKCDQCKTIGRVTVFVYVFDWVITAVSFRQLKRTLLNPLDALSGNKILKYTIFAFIIAATAVVLSSMGNLIGISVS